MVKKKVYSVKRAFSIKKPLSKKLDKVKMFPKWNGNASSIVNAALEKFFEVEK